MNTRSFLATLAVASLVSIAPATAALSATPHTGAGQTLAKKATRGTDRLVGNGAANVISGWDGDDLHVCASTRRRCSPRSPHAS